MLRAERACKLTGERAAFAMHEFIWQDNGRRQIVFALRQQCGGQRRHAGMIGLLRLRGIKTQRRIGAAGEHDVMAQRVITAAMSKRTNQRPLFRDAREIGEVLADVQPGSARADGLELATDFHGSVRLHVEALMLRESAGKEDVNHRLCPCRLRGRRHSLEGAEMIHAESQQSHRARLNHFTAGNGMRWMRQ